MRIPGLVRMRGGGARVYRLARWAGLAAALPLLWACGDRTVAPPDYHPSRTVGDNFPASQVGMLDLLFMIDNSQSMAPLQDKLLREFPGFMQRLKDIPTADGSGTSLPDIHVAVISSNTGTGRVELSSDYHCPPGGDDGQFQYTARGTCTTSPLHSSPTQQRFLSASNNQGIKNYDGDISDAFRCIAALGDQGCGFEGQLKSVRWALDPLAYPEGNQGFLRDQALLAVVLITNEDDCSLPDDSLLVAGDEASYGPLTSFRCNEYGHRCLINGTLQSPPRGAAANLMNCESNEDGTLLRVADEVAFLKSLKDEKRLFVAAITGPPTLYNITMAPRGPGNPQLVPTVAHSCVESNGEYGDPAVRLDQWVQSFGANGKRRDICASSFKPALDAIADALIQRLQPQCIQATLVDADPASPALEPECAVSDTSVDEQGHVHDAVVHACADDAAPPCWSLDDDLKCPGSKLVHVARAPGSAAAGLTTHVSCATCIAGVARAGCPCIAGKEVDGCLR